MISRDLARGAGSGESLSVPTPPSPWPWLKVSLVVASITMAFAALAFSLPVRWAAVVLGLGGIVFVGMLLRNPALYLVRLASLFAGAAISIALAPSFSGHFDLGAAGTLMISSVSSGGVALGFAAVVVVLALAEAWIRRGDTESEKAKQAGANVSAQPSTAGTPTLLDHATVQPGAVNSGSGPMFGLGGAVHSGQGPMTVNYNWGVMPSPTPPTPASESPPSPTSPPKPTEPKSSEATVIETVDEHSSPKELTNNVQAKLLDFFGYETCIIAFDDRAKSLIISTMSNAHTPTELQKEILAFAKNIPIASSEHMSELVLSLLDPNADQMGADFGESSIIWQTRMQVADLDSLRAGRLTDKQFWDKIEFFSPQLHQGLNRPILRPSKLLFLGGFHT